MNGDVICGNHPMYKYKWKCAPLTSTLKAQNLKHGPSSMIGIATCHSHGRPRAAQFRGGKKRKFFLVTVLGEGIELDSGFFTIPSGKNVSLQYASQRAPFLMVYYCIIKNMHDLYLKHMAFPLFQAPFILPSESFLSPWIIWPGEPARNHRGPVRLTRPVPARPAPSRSRPFRLSSSLHSVGTIAGRSTSYWPAIFSTRPGPALAP